MPNITRMFHEVFQMLWSKNYYYYDYYPFLVQWLVDAWVCGPSLWLHMFWTPFTLVSTDHLRLDHSRWMIILDVNWPKPLVCCSQPVIRHLMASIGQFYLHVVLVYAHAVHLENIWLFSMFNKRVTLYLIRTTAKLSLQSSCWLR